MVWRLIMTGSIMALVAGGGPAATRPATTQPTTQPATGVAFFNERIAPVLANECYGCHHAKSLVSNFEGGLLLDSLAGMLKGGDSGKPAIVPGDPDKGMLMPAIRYGFVEEKGGKKRNMPPKWGKDYANGGKLPERTIADFAEWIRIGAPVPAEFRQAKELKF
jgi:hypothetical protein